MSSTDFISTAITELPSIFPGRILRSPMPFRSGDKDGRLYDQIKEYEVSVIVLLASDQECIEKSGRDLRAFYANESLDVIYLPTPDFGVPENRALDAAVDEALARLQAGANLLVHCNAGIGRTGTFLACLAKRGMAMSAEQAIGWVRKRIPGALETTEQLRLVAGF
ncbi:MAG TPA: protein-tyrosine phosphatase family protein [Anaerolineales bacterium]|nr:protein-tyrosine phosphatase family protein [Anaerolineales bacterium]